MQADAITGFTVRGGPLRLRSLCIAPVAKDSAKDWEAIPGLEYPLTLPLTHPDYPASRGPEDLDRARAECRRRLLFQGRDTARVADDLTPPPITRADSGTVTIDAGSPVVTGIGVDWGEELAGGVLKIQGESTGYTVVSILRSDRLLLSRDHPSGVNGANYTIDDDPAAQLHDSLAGLLDGGPGGTSMAERVLLPHIGTGTASVDLNANGEPRALLAAGGTPWTTTLEGLAIQFVREDSGTVRTTQGNDRLVGGPAGGWGPGLEGLDIEIGGEGDSYRIAGVDPQSRSLILSTPYRGTAASGLQYRILEPFAWRIDRVLGPDRALLEQDYVGDLGVARGYVLRPPTGLDGEGGISLPMQRPLDLVLTAALNAGVAQMLRLAWVDTGRTGATPQESYDYLLMADRDGSLAGLPEETADPDQAARLITSSFARLEAADSWIVHDLRTARAAPLEPVQGAEVFALPPRPAPEDRDPLRQNVAGLKWADGGPPGPTRSGLLGVGRPIFYHVWRDRLENEPVPEAAPSAADADPSRATLVTADSPLAIAAARPPVDPPLGWPSFPLDHLDFGLEDGWYSYRLSGIDIFGRHTPMGPPLPWLDFDPAAPAPGGRLNPVALLLRNRIPPGAPTGVEAVALDPRDRFVLRDSAYRSWRSGLPDGERESRVGLRVEWRWTSEQQRVSPDVEEFRIYHHPDRLNAVVGTALSAQPLAPDRSTVTLQVEGPVEGITADSLVDAWLRRGPDAFRIVGNAAASTASVRITVAHNQPIHSLGEITGVVGDRVEGSDTSWTDDLVGELLQIGSEIHRIASVEAPESLTLETTPSSGVATGGYGIRRAPKPGDELTVQIPNRTATGSPNPAHTDYRSPTAWRRRIATMDYGAGTDRIEVATDTSGDPMAGGEIETPAGGGLRPVTGRDGAGNAVFADLSGVLPDTHWIAIRGPDGSEEHHRIASVDSSRQVLRLHAPPASVPPDSSWGIGPRVRGYTAFLDAPDTGPGGSFEPTPDVPIRVGQIGVTAVDARGGESEVGGPSTIVRVLRDRPPAPPAPLATEEKIFATAADYHGRSYYSFRWAPPPAGVPYGVHIYRAMERSVFQRDWLIRRTRAALDAADPIHLRRCFPDGLSLSPGDIAASLNQLEPKADHTAGLSQYRQLLTHEDHWLVLAALPGNEGVAPLSSISSGAIPSEERDALLDRLIARDYEIRVSRGALAPGDPAFTDEARWNDVVRLSPSSTEEKRRSEWVADALNAIDHEGDYRSLPLQEDAWRVLASLPGNEVAFSRVTSVALDPADPGVANRRGPDDADDFVVGDPGNPLADAGLRVFVDELPGRSRNAYLYRARYVDRAQNLGAFSVASPPVHLPVVEPPRAPKVGRVSGGEGRVMLFLAPSREPHAAVHAIYRTDDAARTRDARLLGDPIGHVLVHPCRVEEGTVAFDARLEAALIERVYDADDFDPTVDLLDQPGVDQWLATSVPVGPGGLDRIDGVTGPDGSRAVVVYRDRDGALQHTPWKQQARRWVDAGVRPLVNYHYRIVTVGSAGQRSPLSKPVLGRAFERGVADAPAPTVRWQGTATREARVEWNSEGEARLERAPAGSGFWRPVGGWEPAGDVTVLDRVDPTADWKYRVRVRNGVGAFRVGQAVQLPADGGSP